MATWIGVGCAAAAALAAWIGIVVNAARIRATNAALLEERSQRERMALAQERIGDTLTALATGRSSESDRLEWHAENFQAGSWTLRNISTTTATNVQVDKARLGGVRVDITGPTDLPPMASLTIHALAAFGAPVASEVWLTCDQEPEPRAVPLPRWF